MPNVVKKDFEGRKVTVEIHWMDLDHFIHEYDGYAAKSLRENNINDAMYWADRSKKLEDIKEEFRKNKG